MEAPTVMDRLVCGDVGYGKTEIALRAAFKAVMGGRQVALLAPTTILVEQHYETFEERFARFPVRIEMLSRFREPREEKKVVDRRGRGRQVDIVIGTHRLIQKDVRFHNLGLLVVDEEQRFGVKHKERLKQLKTNVDCLTLTATPIPRTLNMSLMKIRDMSILNTAPQNRLPIETFVTEFDEAIAARAIRARDRPRRAGVLPAQPGRDHRRRCTRSCGGSCPRCRVAVAPRPAGRGGAGGGDAPVRARRDGRCC